MAKSKEQIKLESARRIYPSFVKKTVLTGIRDLILHAKEVATVTVVLRNTAGKTVGVLTLNDPLDHEFIEFIDQFADRSAA